MSAEVLTSVLTASIAFIFAAVVWLGRRAGATELDKSRTADQETDERRGIWSSPRKILLAYLLTLLTVSIAVLIYSVVTFDVRSEWLWAAVGAFLGLVLSTTSFFLVRTGRIEVDESPTLDRMLEEEPPSEHPEKEARDGGGQV
jgi:ABC-type Fe3+ transport system permease subunit